MCSEGLKVGISREFPNKLVRWHGSRFFRPLLYQLSYLGGTLILLEIRGAGTARNRAMV